VIPQSTLTPRERLIIQLHYGECWTLTDIASAIGVCKQNVSRSHRRALRRIYDDCNGQICGFDVDKLRLIL
jgi:RNA polymerase sigma factor (sigma-70 family)